MHINALYFDWELTHADLLKHDTNFTNMDEVCSGKLDWGVRNGDGVISRA